MCIRDRLGRLRQENGVNPGGGACSESRSRHCTPAWATERNSVSKKKTKKKNRASFQKTFFLKEKKSKTHHSTPDREKKKNHKKKKKKKKKNWSAFQKKLFLKDKRMF